MAYNVLIVDDSATVRAIIARSLKLAQIPIGEVFQATNGKEGLQVLADNWIDLVIADLNMPVMTGVEMVEQMNADGLMQNIPVIIVTADGSRLRRGELAAQGVAAFIRKPFTPEMLRDVVITSIEDADAD